MADLPALAPTSTDNNTVILWVVLVLVATVILVGRVLWAKMQSNEAHLREEAVKAQERADAANARVEAAQAKIMAVQGEVVMDQQKTQLLSNAAMNRVAEAVETLTTAIRHDATPPPGGKRKATGGGT